MSALVRSIAMLYFALNADHSLAVAEDLRVEPTEDGVVLMICCDRLTHTHWQHIDLA